MGSATRSKGIFTRAMLSSLLAVGFVLPIIAAPAVAGSGETVTFVGGGWGHSVGLSQYGAQGQALEDPTRTGAEIASHYYSGSSVKQLAATLPADHFLLDDGALWVGLLQNTTSFTFIPVGGPVELCQDGDGQQCPRTVGAEDGEAWTIVRSGSSCQFKRNGKSQGPSGKCSAAISWNPGSHVRLPQWSDRSVGQGSLQIRPVGGGFHVSLAIGLDDYVDGIAEMPADWEPAALEAQAIASRSYAAAKAQQRVTGPRLPNGDPGLSGAWIDRCWCHIRHTTDQVYVGYSREQKALWAAASDRTAGMVLTHPDDAFTQNGIVEAFFSSSTAGVTESNRFGFGSSVQYPYLVAVDDHWSADPSLNPYANWEVTVSAATVMTRLRTTSESWRVDFDELTAVSLVNGPPWSTVRFTGRIGSATVSVDASGGWMRGFGLKSAQITGTRTTLANPEPEPEPGGVVEVSGYRVDDGPSHDGTGNDSKGNNDGAAQCGETIELYVTAHNTGDATVKGLSAVLTEADPYVTILYNSSASYPNLGPGNSAENPKDWDLRISSNAPAGHKAKLTLKYTATTDGPWTHTINLPIACGDEPEPEPEPGGVVEVSGYRVDDGPSHDGTGNDSKGNNDGAAQCGETIELYVTAHNTGDATVKGLSAVLTEADPYVTILYNSSASYPNLGPGNSAENPKDWDLRISSNAPAGHKAKLTLKYTATTDGPWTHTINLPIACGDEPEPEPEPGGVVEVSGYRVDDGPSHDGTGNDSKGNNDGAAQCGETIELYVTAHNTGDATVKGLSAVLTEADPYVTILYNSSASYPNLGPGNSAENPKDWDLRISSNAPAGHKAKLTLKYTATTDGPWTHTINLPIACGDEPEPEPEPGGVVEVSGYRVDDGPSHDGTGNDSKGNNDGAAQCGETIEMYVTVGNEGASTLDGLSAKLTEADPYVTILYNTSSFYPDIGAGKQAENPRDWDLRISSSAPAGHKAKLTLKYTAASGGPWTIPVELPIACGA